MVRKYYEVVRKHLEERGLWSRTVAKFPPATIMSAIRRILGILDEHYVDPELLDWGSLFESLHEFPTVDAFIKYLQRERLIPYSREERISEVADEIERELTELIEEAKDVAPDVLRRIREKLSHVLGEADELAKLRGEVDRLKREVREKREKIKEYSEKLREAEEKVEALRAEVEKLRHEVETARKLPPRIPVSPWAELRSRIEYWIRSQVPRVYRIDWLRERPKVARISYHREVEEELLGKIRELGGEVVGKREVRPPMRVIEVDFSKAKSLPRPPPPEWEYMLLWSKFSAALTAAGLRPEDFRDRFEEVYKIVETLPLDEKQRNIEALARDIIKEKIKPPPPPKPPVTAEEIRKIVAEEVAKVRAVPVAVPEVKTVEMTDPVTGIPYVAPHPDIIPILMSVFPFPREYFLASPRAQSLEYRWSPLHVMIEEALRRPDVLIPRGVLMSYPWILDFLRKLLEALRVNVERFPPDLLTAPSPKYLDAYNYLRERLLEEVRDYWREIIGEPTPPRGSVVYADAVKEAAFDLNRLALAVERGEMSLEEALREFEPRKAEIARKVVEEAAKYKRRYLRGAM